MRRLISTFCFAVGISMVAFGQAEKVKPKIIVGILGAQIDGDRLSGYDKPGGVLGMAMELKLGKKMSIQPEIMYCQKGARSNSKSPYYMIARLNYVDLAAVLNVYLTDRWIIQPGLTYGILYKARVDNGGGFVESNKYFNQADFCYAVAVEYLLSDKLALNIRLARSLSSISPNVNWYNNTLSFTFRVGLNKVGEQVK